MVQGTKRFDPLKERNLELPEPLELPPSESSDAARIVLGEPVPVPPDLIAAQGLPALNAGRPTLLMFWAHWCQVCAAELMEFTRRTGEWRDRGIQVIPMSLDPPEDRTKTRRAAQRLRLPGTVHFVEDAQATFFAALLKSVLDIHDSLTVPLSLLINGQGKLQAVYHLMSRIVGGQSLLDDICKEEFGRMMWQHAEFCGIDVITYCVMSNHFHILVRVPESAEAPDRVVLKRVQALYGRNSGLFKATEKEYRLQGKIIGSRREALLNRMGDMSLFMKELKQHFSRWYNRTHDRYGTLWAERFKSVIVEDQPGVVSVLAAYIDLNPVRAGIVKDPKDYRFCSCAEAVAGGAKAKELRQGIRSFCKRRSWKEAAAEYRELMFLKMPVSGHSKKVAPDPDGIRKMLEDGCELSMKEVLRLHVRYLIDGVALGSAQFVNEIFLEFRNRFSEKRESGARPIRGVGARALKFLKTIRDLRVRRYS